MYRVYKDYCVEIHVCHLYTLCNNTHLNYVIGHCECYWYEQDATTNQGFIAKVNSYIEKQVNFELKTLHVFLYIVNCKHTL